jgi:signal transduction histidine kinase
MDRPCLAASTRSRACVTGSSPRIVSVAIMGEQPAVSATGVGLGLSIARPVATAHRATVTVRSQPDGGLDISVKIPRSIP